jgi:hypothetical protein
MQRAGFKCENCGSEDTTLNVHHGYYIKERTKPWDYPEQSLHCLCEKCHEHVTQLWGGIKVSLGVQPIRELERFLGYLQGALLENDMVKGARFPTEKALLGFRDYTSITPDVVHEFFLLEGTDRISRAKFKELKRQIKQRRPKNGQARHKARSGVLRPRKNQAPPSPSR